MMRVTFLSNTIWYLLLGTVSALGLVLVIIRAPDINRVLSQLFITIGFIFGAEIVIFCFLKAYDYYPLLIPYSKIDDERSGNIFSQFSIAVAALALAVFELKYIWYVVFSLLFCAVELLFLRLGVYTQNWYKIWMTFVGSQIIFLLAKKAYTGDMLFRNKFRRLLSIIIGLYTLHMETVFWPLILTGAISINTAVFHDALISYIVVCLLNFGIIAAGCLVIYSFLLGWPLKAAGIAALYGMVFVADKAGLVHFKEGFFALFASVDIWGMYLYIFVLDRLFPNRAAALKKPAPG